MAIETNSIAVIPLTLFLALFIASLTLYLNFSFKLKELRGRRDESVIKFIKPYFERYANEKSQTKQVKIIGELFKKARYRHFFGVLSPISFGIATILFGMTIFLSILLAFYYNVIILIIVIIIGVSGGVYFIDDIRYFIKLSKLMEDTK